LIGMGTLAGDHLQLLMILAWGGAIGKQKA
jgi:hypothetical protein